MGYIVKRLLLLLSLVIVFFILKFTFYDNATIEFLTFVKHPSYKSFINFLFAPTTIYASFAYLFSIYVVRPLMSIFFTYTIKKSLYKKPYKWKKKKF